MACFLTTWSLNITSWPILSKKQTKRKFPNFDQYGNYLKLIFLSFRGACFLTRWSSDIIFRPNMTKNNQMKNFYFWTKLVGYIKNQHGDYVKWIFFKSSKALFLLHDHQNIIFRPYISKNQQRKLSTFDENMG